MQHGRTSLLEEHANLCVRQQHLLAACPWLLSTPASSRDLGGVSGSGSSIKGKLATHLPSLGNSNCAMRLDQADEQLLQAEIDRIAKALE